MAAVDLYGDEAGQIRNQYKTALGRDASDDEVSNWLSGTYGHGAAGNLSPILSAIQNSHEARNRIPAGTPGPNVVGQPNPDVSTTMPVPTPEPYKNLDYWQGQGVNYDQIFNLQNGQINPGWARTGSGYERTQQATPQVAGPQNGDYQSWFMGMTGGKPPTPETLESMAPMLQQYGIRIGSKGDRGWSDTIILPDGRMYDVIEAAGIGTGKRWQFSQNGGPGYVPQAGGFGGVGLPQSQYSDPHTKMLEQLMLQRINSLQSGQDQGYQQLLGYLQQRFNDLQGPGRTGAENEVIRTQALDPIEQDRTAAKKRIMERMAAAGHTMESGVMQMALAEVDKAFDGMRGSAQTAMGVDELNRREGRNQRAEALAGSIYELPQAREREALGYAGALSDLGPQRLQLAMQASGMGGSPYSMFNSLMQMAQMNQNSALLDQRNSSQLWGGLGELAYMLMNSGR